MGKATATSMSGTATVPTAGNMMLLRFRLASVAINAGHRAQYPA
jgi:hypothetical protein